MFSYNFEKLDVWKISLQVIREVKKIIKKFPLEEKYVLSDQIRRAALSIALNIAEGWGRKTKKDFSRFISNAIGSCLEVIASLKVAIDSDYLKEDEIKNLDESLKELYFKLLKFNTYLNK
ncbi:MAG: four helix bundle protein [Candidatus Nealsonbacteria bacterium]|nr:four helix bundle protein [Candidatus Nealsonbacteria bacterium]